MTIRILTGDCRDVLATLPDASVQCVVTSPPYYGLRDYGTARWDGGDAACEHMQRFVPSAADDPGIRCSTLDGGKRTTTAQAASRSYRDVCGKCGARRVDAQLGLEATPDAYIAAMVGVFREVRRVLRADGVCFVNVGDSYASTGGMTAGGSDFSQWKGGQTLNDRDAGNKRHTGLKPKDLLLMPARLALALQADGWWVRSDIIWAKPNPMPESCTDRPTSAHEHIFLLTKSGSATFWTHRDHAGSRAQPLPDYRWVHKTTREERDSDPGDPETWRRINLWRGHDYFYDADAVREPQSEGTLERFGKNPARSLGGAKLAEPGIGIKNNSSMNEAIRSGIVEGGRSCRNVWTIATAPFSGAKMLADYVGADGKPYRRSADCPIHGLSGGRKTPRMASTHGSNARRSSRNNNGKGCMCEVIFVDHFATFPPELAERCIRAGTSERGCCAACGAPWVRQVERQAYGDKSGGSRSLQQGFTRNAMGGQKEWDSYVSPTTTGWAASCTCDAATVPCTVLDPFSGAGTTALVADRLGRDAIGIDLSHAYVEMTRERLTADCPLFMAFEASPPPAEDPEDTRMADLFQDMAAD